MSLLDDFFPDPNDCYFALFQDAVYEHDTQINYTLENGQFKRRDRVSTVKRIKDISELLYGYFVKNDDSFTRCNPQIDYNSLLGVLTRYSRDIYGFRRISAKIRSLETNLTTAQQEQLEQIISEGADFGFKIPSRNPYIERQASVLLYWFSVLKPFHLIFEETKAYPPEPYIQSYFNEYFAYYLICLALHPLSVNLTIHKNKDLFIEFLNQLHFRNLSRSSLEFFLPYRK
jgi:hypothetical protein